MAARCPMKCLGPATPTHRVYAETKCPLCLEMKSPVNCLPCGHVACDECWEKWRRVCGGAAAGGAAARAPAGWVAAAVAVAPQPVVASTGAWVGDVCGHCRRQGRRGLLVLRRNSTNGSQFLGCSKFPDCTNTRRFSGYQRRSSMPVVAAAVAARGLDQVPEQEPKQEVAEEEDYQSEEGEAENSEEEELLRRAAAYSGTAEEEDYQSEEGEAENSEEEELLRSPAHNRTPAAAAGARPLLNRRRNRYRTRSSAGNLRHFSKNCKKHAGVLGWAAKSFVQLDACEKSLKSQEAGSRDGARAVGGRKKRKRQQQQPHDWTAHPDGSGRPGKKQAHGPVAGPRQRKKLKHFRAGSDDDLRLPSSSDND
eukprot:COSAG05_NODE_488_length_9324_cov_10.796336_2_plen_366_part_00